MKITFEGTPEDVAQEMMKATNFAYLSGEQMRQYEVSRDTAPKDGGEDSAQEEAIEEALAYEKTKSSRRKSSAKAKPKPEPEAKEPEKKSTSRRKGSAPAKAATKVVQNTGDEISDADVAKAASNAAQVLTPAVVKAVLEEYGVGGVQELEQGQRREFIDQLNGLLAEANE